MRWTNWYLHPADNRYYVFEFRDVSLADEYEGRLQAGGVGFEREDPLSQGDSSAGEEVVHRFGVHRKDFKDALRLNHLLHGEHRSPFIPHAGLRWGMLAVTAGVVMLALWGWLQS